MHVCMWLLKKRKKKKKKEKETEKKGEKKKEKEKESVSKRMNVHTSVPTANLSNSNTPIGPFQITVLVVSNASLNVFTESGPISNPIQPSGMAVDGTTCKTPNSFSLLINWYLKCWSSKVYSTKANKVCTSASDQLLN